MSAETTGISRRLLTNAVVDRLETVQGLTVYRGEVAGAPPVVTADDGTADPSGRVAPYAVVRPSPGRPDLDGEDLAETYRTLDWVVQITVGAGWSEDLDAAVDDIDTALNGWSPDLPGCSTAALRPPLGFDPGPARRDDTVEPPEHYVPLQYRLTATR